MNASRKSILALLLLSSTLIIALNVRASTSQANFIYLPVMPQTVPQFNVDVIPFAENTVHVTNIVHAGDERLFVTEKAGRILVVLSTGEVLATPFLDLSGQITAQIEQGLLGLAFDPNYVSNGRFYVNYTDLSGNTTISRFLVSGDPNVADPASELILLTIPQFGEAHNGGSLVFGPNDGYLYVSVGDGACCEDPPNRAQNLGLLLGKVLRLDVSGNAVVIPNDNPFVGVPGARPEIWAYGLRNPWRITFDRLTGDLFIADVGAARREEVNHQPAASGGGQNYGWRCYEGDLPFNQEDCPDPSTFTFPVVTYDHSPAGGCSITGGYVYRGSDYPAMAGNYFFADLCTGRISKSWQTPAGAWYTETVGHLPGSASTFGENAAGELFIASYSTFEIYRIVLASNP